MEIRIHLMGTITYRSTSIAITLKALHDKIPFYDNGHCSGFLGVGARELHFRFLHEYIAPSRTCLKLRLAANEACVLASLKAETSN